MRSPSENLIQLLSDLQLCTRREIELCEPRVRRLAQDLPDFDSVWIDALVQQRVLTPWQADVLQSPHPSRLNVGEFVLRDSSGEHTFVGTSARRNRVVSVRRLDAPAASQSERLRSQAAQLLERIDDMRRSAPPSICLPRLVETVEAKETEEDNSKSFVVSDYVSGWTAEELLIRGGRLSWPAVAEIGRQLLSAVRWMESQQLLHGEIVLRNIRLQPNGEVVLVCPFIARLQTPTISFTAAQRLRDVETTAPELVGTGTRPDSRSELYAVGCVLWQLLTSRPVFLSADPVTRQLQAREHDIVDVRSIVPDCPDWMARLIHSFTRRSPQLRPASCDSAFQEWTRHCSSATSATRNLIKRLPDRSFQQATQRRSMKASSSWQIWRTVAAVAVMVSAFLGYGIHRGLVPLPLHLTRLSGEPLPTETNVAPQTELKTAADIQTVQQNAVETMPLPDPAGVVSLRSGGVYKARDLKFAGVMHIETTADAAATVMSDGSAWNIQASQIVMSNIQIDIAASDATREPVAAIECTCDVLSLRNCTVNSISGNSLASSVKWQPLADTARVISIKDCVLSGAGYGLWLQRIPERCELENVLVTKSGAAMCCDVTTSNAAVLQFDMKHITQVGGTAFLDVVSEDARPQELLVRVKCGESVLAPSSALVRVAAPADWSFDRLRVEFLLPERGNPTIVSPDVDPVVCFDRSLQQLVQLPDSQVVVESLLIAKPLFRGSSDDLADNPGYSGFELLDYEGPKLSPDMPGVILKDLPERSRERI